MNRHQARKLAFQMIYALDFQQDTPLAELYAASVTDRGITEELPYLEDVFYNVGSQLSELDELIGAHIKQGWKLSRLSKVTHAILRLATYEMLFVADVPFPVAINEAVQMAKEYDEESAPAFINGVLNAIADTKGLKSQT